jgi:hypothetical protein
MKISNKRNICKDFFKLIELLETVIIQVTLLSRDREFYFLKYTLAWRAQLFQKAWSNLRILGVRKLIWSKFHTYDPPYKI